MARLDTYRAKRDKARTPEPVPDDLPDAPAGNTFVIQEHHARALHWDFRLERDGVLVSWAVPKGVPLDPKTNHLAKQTEDHPLEYADFEGEIPKGEYGGGTVTIWDRGTYVCEKWSDREVKVVLDGSRVSGRYVLFRTRGSDWILHRMDPPPSGSWQPIPSAVRPMLATGGDLPPDDGSWAYEMKWDGVRALSYVDGGRLRLLSRNDRDVTVSYPELRPLGAALGSTQAVLDGEIVAFDEAGRPSFGVLQQRMHVRSDASARRLAESTPVTYLLFDLLHLDGHSLLDLPYRDRRDLLERLDLQGAQWQTPPAFTDISGNDVLEASRLQGLEGLVAKRLDSPYRPGTRSTQWRKVKNVRRQEAVVGGWKPGGGGRSGQIGSLLLGVYDGGELTYVGHVGTGFSGATLKLLGERLAPLARGSAPFHDAVPREHARHSHWVEPQLVVDVEFAEWTRDGRLRHPSYKGLRNDKDPADVTREP